MEALQVRRFFDSHNLGAQRFVVDNAWICVMHGDVLVNGQALACTDNFLPGVFFVSFDLSDLSKSATRVPRDSTSGRGAWHGGAAFYAYNPVLGRSTWFND